jgi:hypothetical protein
MILYAITLKNASKDANGLINHIWATESQIKTIGELRNNPQTRFNFIEISDFIFSPMDISHIEKKNTDNIGVPIPKYAIDRYKQDKNTQLEDGKNKTLFCQTNLMKNKTRKELLMAEYIET